jgi:hypothetical protein
MKEETTTITNKADKQLTDTEKFYEQLENIQQVDETLPSEAENTDVDRPDKGLDDSVDNNSDDDSIDNSDIDNSKNHLIPRSRLNKELEKRKALEEQIEKEKQERIKAQTELELYTKALDKSFNLQNKDAQEDLNAINPLDEEAHKFYMENFKQVQQMQQQMLLQKTLEAQETQFTAKQNDFPNAYQHLIEVQTKINKNLGLDDNTAQQIAFNNLRNMAENALSKGKNVAETFYNIAKECGYRSNNNKGPNLDAINENMKKSKTADVNSLPVNINDGGSHYTKMSEFDKHYKTRDDFYQMLNQIKGK